MICGFYNLNLPTVRYKWNETSLVIENNRNAYLLLFLITNIDLLSNVNVHKKHSPLVFFNKASEAKEMSG